MAVELTLPWPPSVNHYWRNVKGRTLISKAGREYRKEVAKLCMGVPSLGDARLFVDVMLYPPDRRRRDIDNSVKALLDALEKANVFDDDCQIDHLVVSREHVSKPGFVDVSLEAR